jgi:two-component system, NtrC family, nitrogen regulation response regulator NtrX
MTVEGARILLVDNELPYVRALARELALRGWATTVAGTGPEALHAAQKEGVDAALVDLHMPGMDGVLLLEQLRASQASSVLLSMSAALDIAITVRAIRAGAEDVLVKPIDVAALDQRLRARLTPRTRPEPAMATREAETASIVGDAQSIRAVREQIRTVARFRDLPVLITGETGTGKELVAQAVHASSETSGPFVPVNCAAIPEHLFESELFGHEAGAFTGASRQRKGKFERAHQGTLFLDEVGDMPVPMQAKLLRVLQEGEIERVGGSELMRVDVRVIAATNKDLVQAQRAGEFRDDLFDRLNVLPLRVPPLRERKVDIPLLAKRFVAQSGKNNDRPNKHLSDGAEQLLLAYDYPGNVRELKNLIERLVILTPGDEIGERDARVLLPTSASGTPGLEYDAGRSLREMLDDAERALIRKALDHHLNNVTATADALGLERSHLYKKMRALGLR